MEDFNWTCPHCERDVTISGSRTTSSSHTLSIENLEGRRTLVTRFIVCPNKECRRFTLTAGLFESKLSPAGERFISRLEEWNLIPNSKAKTFPTYIPKAILDDYREACLIRDLSPKASATLARRCLQGILRDFWQVRPGRLVDEIEQVNGKVDPLAWGAIEAVRKLGNIGAHMEKDINMIVDVDPDEADLMIGLVETLLREWYVAREERKKRMGAIVTAASAKAPKVAGP
ncbi:MAG: DUF4145 domain-containing protein [Nitrospiraceae bacterium]